MENQAFNEPSIKQIVLKWGFMSGVAAILLSIILQLAGLATESWVAIISIAISIALIILAHRAFKNEGDGYLTYGQGLKIGTLMSLIGGAMNSIFSYLYLTLIDDSLIRLMQDKIMDKWEKQGMTDSQIEQAWGWMSWITNPVALNLMGFLSAVFWGVIISLIISAITKNTRPEFE